MDMHEYLWVYPIVWAAIALQTLLEPQPLIPPELLDACDVLMWMALITAKMFPRSGVAPFILWVLTASPPRARTWEGFGGASLTGAVALLVAHRRFGSFQLMAMAATPIVVSCSQHAITLTLLLTWGAFLESAASTESNRGLFLD